ncbi:MAG: type V CRISPR-associated protein Cas12a/Cpf1, partial [Candidatus Riflebacteria bacterium]|nr:type V CRISPR-associated protein Cas12a/Cpf1 [Candidatus Riflebacteria bacterium]
LPEAFASDEDLIKGINEFYAELCEKVLCAPHSLKALLLSLKAFNLKGLYLPNDGQLTNISQKLFQDWSIISDAVKAKHKREFPQKSKESTDKFEERCDKYVKNCDSFSVAYINECLNEAKLKVSAEDYFISLGKSDSEADLFEEIQNRYNDAKELLNSNFSKKKLANDEAAIEKIKAFLDSILNLHHFVKPLMGKGNEPEKDEVFYGEFTALSDELKKIIPLYNKVRNYITQKPYSTEKFKLNFENTTFMDGWDLNKESANLGVILLKDNNYYLGVMDKKNNRALDIKNLKSEGKCYKKVEYKLLPGPNKMLPKVFFSKSRIDEFKPTQKLLANYEKGTHKKGDNFNLEHCHELINFFKTSIFAHEDWKNFGFKFSETETYADLSGFYREVEQQGYKIGFRDVSEDYINELINNGSLYLFQIYNKDFSPFSKGIPNLHTLYFKMLFDGKNLTNTVYKLNGEAEVFFRERSISDEKVTHPAKIPIKNKNDNNNRKESVFDYDLIKNRRYTVDKFQLHIPITLNFKSANHNNINNPVNEYISSGGIEHIIGVDRGERHLLYLSVIDLNGNIVEQYSLNEICNTSGSDIYKTNYHALIDKREKDRQKAQQSWKSIESIKELKEGYLSQVINKIAHLMVKYRAITALEDLNFGFMRGRQKVEKQVYQKFERMLIDKLNYLVDKKAVPESFGGLLKAYQLANKFESFKELGKQSGFLFYVPAWNTSKIDPVTGFVNLFNTRYKNIESSKAFFSNFESIKYNKNKNFFEFSFDYNNFGCRIKSKKTKWKVCTNSTRIDTFRNPEKLNKWESKEINLTNSFKALFASANIDIYGNIKEKILKQSSKEFFKNLLSLVKLTLQMRNSISNSEVDYLISPVSDANGEFFDSRNEKPHLPLNADANGAYNIARKGLWVIKQIQSNQNKEKLNLAISNAQWLDFATKSA